MNVELDRLFEKQRESAIKAMTPSYEVRMDRLRRLHRAVADKADEIVETVVADFGHRSTHETRLAEVCSVLSNLKYSMKRLRRWMRPRRRSVALSYRPARSKVISQPKGVVGIVSPWNYPVSLAVNPLTAAVAAGNRVLIKPSELTPLTSELIRTMVSETFSEEEVAVVLGGPEVGQAFCGLRFDHLFFTGSNEVGRCVARQAAENLTPVTLELGGKSPAIIHPSFPLNRVAKRIIAGKFLNSGQTCVAPDYVMVHQESVEALITVLRETFSRCYPTVAGNVDYTAIVNDRHFARIESLLTDAREKGARLVPLSGEGEQSSQDRPGVEDRRITPTLVVGVSDEMRLMQEEIFGPVLPLREFSSVDEAVEYVNHRPRPLALYYFDDDRARVRSVLERTISGGACVNETVLHVAQDDLPFGGVGESGMGSYHCEEGFRTFSHEKAVFYKGRWNSANLLLPPYGKTADRVIDFLFKQAR